MTEYNPLTFQNLDEDAVVRAILEGTARETGARFFAALDAFTRGRKKDDDVTLVVIKINAPSTANENWQI